MSSLPFHDKKPQGAADFYFGINATFRYVQEQFGSQGLRDFWRELGSDYQAPVWTRWEENGLPAVAEYWRDFFDAEPGADVDVAADADEVVLTVHTCPAISHLRAHDRDIVADFCQHCYFMGDAAADQAGLTIRVRGGNGSCRQVCRVRGAAADQDLSEIASCEEAADAGRL